MMMKLVIVKMGHGVEGGWSEGRWNGGIERKKRMLMGEED
jgi:hypothetical protein